MVKFISIIVDTNAMISFFKKDPTIGTPQNPYIADHFVTTDAPQAIWKGAKILVLETDTEYRIQMLESTQSPSLEVIHPTQEQAAIVFKQISDTIPSEAKWEAIFNIEEMNTLYNADGSLVVFESNIDSINCFSIKTNSKITLKNNLQYNILFKFGNPTKYAVIDPFIENTSSVGEDPDDENP